MSASKRPRIVGGEYTREAMTGFIIAPTTNRESERRPTMSKGESKVPKIVHQEVTREGQSPVYTFQCPRCLIVSMQMSRNPDDAPTCCGGERMIPILVGDFEEKGK